MKFRDILWDYPDITSSVTKAFAPFSYIMITLVFVYFIGVSVFGNSDWRDIMVVKDSSVISEGTVGSLGNLNPIYIPQGQVDRDLQALLFRKLVKIDGQGDPVPDLIKSWSVSSDLLTYDFVLDSNAKWHDGEAVTSDDVVFTVKIARELSDRLAQETVGQGFEGLNVTKVDRYRFKVTLDEYSATFWETLSVYIVPEHILKNVSLSQIADSGFNRRPIGNGYFEVSSVNNSLVVLKRSLLYPSSSNIVTYNYYIFKSVGELEVAFRNNRLDIVSGVALRDMEYMSEYSKSYDILTTVIGTRKKVLFLNNRVNQLGSPALRRGLNYILDRDEVLIGAKVDGVSTYSSYSMNSWVYDRAATSYRFDEVKASEQLALAGYTKNVDSGYYQSSDGKVLTVRLTYLDNDVNSAIASTIKDLLDAQGVIVELDGQSYDRMTKETLATRDYDILMFEIETSIDPDQYDLWHSLRRDYPYLNLAGYSNERVDIFLERGRTQTKKDERVESYRIAQRLINEDSPAVFLYEPKFNLVLSNRLSGVSLIGLNYPEQRFDNVKDWSY